MADLDTVYVVTEVDETDIGKIQIGQPVTINVEAYPDMPFQGEVLKIAPQGQVIQNVTTFEVTSELKNVAATHHHVKARCAVVAVGKAAVGDQISQI